MNIKQKKLGLVACAATGAAFIAVPSMANHSWSSYHWERTGTEITVPVVDFTTGEWAQSNRAKNAVDDWNASDYIQSPYSRGSGINTACSIVAGEIHVCNDDYGSTGWLGIASITATRGRETHITGGVTKVNDYYFSMPQYNTDVWRQLVMCQEIGHDYGLGHQNEDFSTNTTDSCMEYTSTPTAIDKTPDQHDFDQLANIYAHSHGGSTDDGGTGGPGNGNGNGNGGGKGKKLGASGTTPEAWGQAIAFDRQGRPNVFKRSMASYDVITHVTWALETEVDHHHEETGPRKHSGERHF